jgi:competence protein ComEC
MTKPVRIISWTFLSAVLAGIIFISLLLPTSKQPVTGSELTVWMLDVGQGESVLLKEPSGKKILFDGGPDDKVLSEIGSVLPPWDRHIDLVILSHNHSDHIRGLISVLSRYDVSEIWISGAIHTTADYEAFLAQLTKNSLKPTIVYFDTTCQELECPPRQHFGEIDLQVYHPNNDMTAVLPDHQHDAGVVVKATFSSMSILLTGDLEPENENELLEDCQPPRCSLKANILQVTHHGSGNATSKEFLEMVKPQAALIPVGLNNSFGHPREQTLERLKSAGVPIFRTDTQGRIKATINKDHFSISTTR